MPLILAALLLSWLTAAASDDAVRWPSDVRITGKWIQPSATLFTALLHPDANHACFRIRVRRAALLTFQLGVGYRTVRVSETQYRVDERQKGQIETRNSQPQSLDVPEPYAAIETRVNGAIGPVLLTDTDGIAELDLSPAAWQQAQSAQLIIKLFRRAEPIATVSLGSNDVEELLKSIQQRVSALSDLGRMTEALALSSHGLHLNSRDATLRTEHGWALAGLMRGEEAEQELADVVRTNPEPRTLVYYASVLSDLGKTREAGGVADNVLQNHGSQLNAVLKAAASSLRAAWRNQQGDAVGALQDMQQAVLLQPRMRSYYAQRAGIYTKLNDEAHHDRDLSTVHAMAADDLLAIGDVDAASDEAEQAVSLAHERFADPYLIRGRIHRLRKEDRLAISDYLTALNIDPQNISAHFNIGYLLFAERRVADALPEFSFVVDRDSSYREARKFRGFSYLLLANAGAAVSDLQAADDGSDPEVLTGIVEAKVQAGDYGSAQTYAQRLCAALPASSLAWYESGKLNFLSGNIRKAIEDLDYAVILDYVPSAYSLRGMAKVNLGDYVGALTDFEFASAGTDPEWPIYVAPVPAAMRTLAWGVAAYQTADYKNAVWHFGDAIEADSSLAAAYLGRAHAMERTGSSNVELKQVLSDLENAVKQDPRLRTLLQGEINALDRRLAP